MHAFRDGLLIERALTIEPSAPDTAVLGVADEAALARWLGPGDPSAAPA